MANVKIMALGGLDEKEKGMFILEIDAKIFILDAGIHEPLTKNFGIEILVPKLDYLKENKDKIKGVFLSSPSWHQIGGLSQLIKIKKDIKVYGSKILIETLPIFFPENTFDTEIITDKTTVAGVDITFLPVASGVPGTVGMSFSTSDGNIVYLTDYIFDQLNEVPVDTMLPITTLSEQKTLLMMSDSLNSFLDGSISPYYKISREVRSFFTEGNRIIATIYENSVVNFIELVEMAIEAKYTVEVADEKFRKVLKVIQDNGMIPPIAIKPVSDKRKTNSLLVISGNKTDLYANVEKILKTGFKKGNYIVPEDTVAILSPPQAGNEHVFQGITNQISKIDPTLVISKKLDFHPAKFDIKNYINFIKPKNFMPIRGYYKELLSAANVAMANGINKKNVILAKNGDINVINNGNNEGLERKVKEIGEMIIEATNDEGIDTSVLAERQELGKNGLAVISFVVDKQNKKITSWIDIQMKGVVILRSQDKMIEKIETHIKKTVEENKTDWKINRVASQLNKEISKIMRNEIKKVPTLVFQIKEI